MAIQWVSSRRKIVFISHDAYRAGASMLLLNFLRWLRANTTIPFEIVIREGEGASGELEAEFATLAPVFVLDRTTSPEGHASGGIVRRLAARAMGTPVGAPPRYCAHCGARVSSSGDRPRQLGPLLKRLAREDVALIYSNTVTNGEVFEPLASLGRPIISHVHELDYWIRYRIGMESFRWVQKYTDHYVAVSEAVKSNLVQSHGIPEASVDVVHGFVPVHALQAGGLEEARRRVRDELAIPADSLIVAASGATEWWKGPDLFIQLAHAVRQRGSKAQVSFLWVGGEAQGFRFAQLQHDIVNLGLATCTRFLGVRRNAYDYFAAADVFVLVSRVDSFPLAVLEAAALGKPIVCFDGSGGAKEFVEDDAGVVAPYLDVPAMAERVTALLESPALRGRLGQRAAAKVRERHDVSVAAPRLLKIIQRFL